MNGQNQNATDDSNMNTPMESNKLSPENSARDQTTHHVEDKPPRMEIRPDEVPRVQQNIVRKKKKRKGRRIQLFEKFNIEDKTQNKQLFNFLNNNIVQLYLLILTFYALFADDYRIITSPKNLDIVYDVITLISIVSFTTEIVISVFAKVGYFLSYFFFLDIISTFSLVLDIVLVKIYIIELGESIDLVGFTKLGKVIRLIRLFRLIRISKVFKSLSSEDNDLNLNNESKKSSKDSKVGKVLSERATKRVILTTFLLLIFLPLFDASFWQKAPEGIQAVCIQLSVMAEFSYTNNVASFDTLIFDSQDFSDTVVEQNEHLNQYFLDVMDDFKSEGGPIVLIDFPKTRATFYLDESYSKIRKEEILRETCEMEGGDLIIEQDNSEETKNEARLNILRTFFVSLLLLGGSFLFGIDIYNLVINPIERMITKVKDVIERPQLTKEEAFIKQEEELNNELKRQNDYLLEDDEEIKGKKSDQLETQIIEKAIRKIGILLGIGLGEAGTGLITNFIGTEGEVDIIMPGQKIMAVLAFCDIRNFTDVTEVLEEKIMVFVNRIAYIVHSITDKYMGTANKNVGDAFMLVWKAPYSIKEQKNIDSMSEDETLRTNIMDLALFTFLKMFAEINRNSTLKPYLFDERIHARKELGPNYKVRIGSGLDYGWAIEGAIGTYHKIDASYLSPHVNICMDLEGSTKQYLVSLLISGAFYQNLSEHVKTYCRKIDIVMNPNMATPLSIYTPNVSDRALFFPTLDPLKMITTPLKDSYQFKKLLEHEMLENTRVGPYLFQNDPDVSLITCFNDEEFLTSFNIGFEAYERGDWKMARDYFERICKDFPEDRPTTLLLDYMKSKLFEAPADWTGVRLE